ncbi:unnamed protein product [Onchocerca ochengi]|uniref:Heterocycloanthracin/sonorensin family bacteriocin n=1 Tax=Onchocerca ochengi TaxID=42157 RepID=A0A182E1Z6_ONCOC|nr:unnamed protein product [Onchocerca ochengi]
MYLPIKAKATAAAKNDLIAAAVNPKTDGEIATIAESDGEIATVEGYGVRLANMERELQYDSLISNSDSELKHELEHSADGAGRTRRSCGTGCGGCGGCGCGGCGGCGCGCGCGCCQKSCCCSTCTVTTTCCKKCCCQSCCGCGNCGGDCGSGGCGGGGHGRKKRGFTEPLGEREKRSPRSSRRRVANDVLTNKTAKVPIAITDFWIVAAKNG